MGGPENAELSPGHRVSLWKEEKRSEDGGDGDGGTATWMCPGPRGGAWRTGLSWALSRVSHRSFPSGTILLHGGWAHRHAINVTAIRDVIERRPNAAWKRSRRPPGPQCRLCKGACARRADPGVRRGQRRDREARAVHGSSYVCGQWGPRRLRSVWIRGSAALGVCSALRIAPAGGRVGRWLSHSRRRPAHVPRAEVTRMPATQGPRVPLRVCPHVHRALLPARRGVS